MKFSLALTMFLISLQLFAEDNAHFLERGFKQVQYVWTNWLGKPALVYDEITTNSVRKLYGTWGGSYIEQAEESAPVVGGKTTIDLNLKRDGTWTSSFRPEMESGHWYLYKGLILFYEQPISQKASMATVMLSTTNEFRLLVADSPDRFVILQLKSPEPSASPEPPPRAASSEAHD